MGLLRDHGPAADEDWLPGKGVLGAEVCMHASFGPVRGSQTTGAMVSHLASDRQTHWLTGTSATCTSVFKPVWIDAGLPDHTPAPTGLYDHATAWWRHENLHREVLRDYATRIKVIEEERNAIEAGFLTQIDELMDASQEARAAFTQSCFDNAEKSEAAWLAKVIDLPISHPRPILDRFAWQGFDRQAKRSSSHQAKLAA
jgi:dipeptidase